MPRFFRAEPNEGKVFAIRRRSMFCCFAMSTTVAPSQIPGHKPDAKNPRPSNRDSRERPTFHFLLSRSFISGVRYSPTSSAAMAMSIVAMSVASSPTAHSLATRSFTVM